MELSLLFLNLVYIQVNEVYRNNNRRLSTTPIQINLTPPPNLVVSAITHPSTTFSGILLLLLQVGLCCIQQYLLCR